MDIQFWRGRWQRGEIGWHQPQINPHLQEHWHRVHAPAGCRVLVPLCGKTLDMLWLAGQGHRVLGVEISEIAVAAFFDENGLEPRRERSGAFERWAQDEIVILQGDFFALDRAQVADVGAVFDRASLVALPPDMRPRYVEHLRSILPRPLPTLLITLEYDQGVMQGPPFAVYEDEVRALYGSDQSVELIATHDVLADSPRFRERGLERLLERVYRIAD